VIDGERLPTLLGTRVRLRWLEPADIGALYDVFSDPEVMRYWSDPPLTCEDDARALLANIERAFMDRSMFQWGVARIADDRVLGTCTLLHVNVTNRRAELGYALGRAHWGQGLMSEALTALLDFAFDGLMLHRLEADTDPRNLPSLRLLERLGFQHEGRLRERWHVGGETQDTAFYGLLGREWRGRRSLGT
jgi:[ribosomal protein S5]-alanine N-acetyltransferase